MRPCRTALSGTWKRRPDRKAKGGEDMAREKFEWHFTHFLKDGTPFKKGMQFPDTPENRATIERVREICRKSLEKQRR
jgi:hypothetical protein